MPRFGRQAKLVAVIVLAMLLIYFWLNHLMPLTSVRVPQLVNDRTAFRLNTPRTELPTTSEVRPAFGNRSGQSREVSVYRVGMDSLAANCSAPYWERAYGSQTVLGGSSLPQDLTYMLYRTCTTEVPTQGMRKLIVNLNRQEWWFPMDPHYRSVFQGCLYDACDFTDNKSLLSVADAVFVTVCRIAESVPPPRASQGQIWIAYTTESPVHYRRVYGTPSWRGVFNWTMGYRTDSDVFSSYGFLAVRSVPLLKNYTAIAVEKRRAIAWFVSHCQTQSQRYAYVRLLQTYIDVDIYGTCTGRNCGSECNRLLNTTYFFYLSFENSLCRDYVTEKLFKIYDSIDVIPIVRGGADYRRYFPPGTFLNTADYTSPRHLADHLKSLMTDPGGYARLLQAKDGFLTNPVSDGRRYRNVCELCKHLHTWQNKSRMYPDIVSWTEDNICQQPSDV